MEKGHLINCLDKGFVRLVDWMGSDNRIVEAARVSYGSPTKTPEEDKKLVGFLWKSKHSTPFEHCKVTLDIKMPIFIARQYIRHRMQCVSEVSARYTELPDEFYIPSNWRRQDTKNKQGSVAQGNWNPVMYDWEAQSDGSAPNRVSRTASLVLEAHCQHAYDTYQEMIKAGIAREMARMVLPVNIYTQMYATWDLKNLLHFVALREDAHAQAEIQEYGRAIKTILKGLFPWTIEAFDRYQFKCLDIQAPVEDKTLPLIFGTM